MIKIKVSRLCEWMVALCVFINGLGGVLFIAGVNVVNYLTMLALILIMVDLVCNNKKLDQFTQGNKFFFIVLFTFWILYACMQMIFMDINAEYFSVGFHQLITNTMFVFLVCYAIHDVKSFNTIRNAMIGVLLVNTIMGLFEVFTGIHFTETENIWTVNSTRVFASNPNEYATTVYCAMMGVMLSSLQGKLNLKMKVLLVASFICIITSDSRGILCAVIIFVLAYCAMNFYYCCRGNTVFIKLLLIMALVLVCYLAASGILMELMAWFVNNFSGIGNYDSDMYRINLIKTGMKYFKESYGVGVGAGQSIYLIKMNLHNFLVEILVEYGVIIFAGVLFILWYIWRMAFERDIPRNGRCIYFALIPSVIMASITSSSINKFKIFWVMLIMYYMSGYYLFSNNEKVGLQRNVYEIS